MPDVNGGSVATVVGFTAGGGGGSVTLVPLVPADFMELAAFTDPHAQMDNPLTVHASNGNVTFEVTTDGINAWDGISDGATWRLVWPAAWRGDGTQKILMRFTYIGQTGVTTSGPVFGIAVCDRGGNAADVAAISMGAGIFVTGLYGGTAVGYPTNGAGTSKATLANGLVTYGNYHPGGPTGDASQVGAPGGVLGTMLCTCYETTTKVSLWATSIDEFAAPQDGFRPLVWMGIDDGTFPGPAGDTFTVTIRMEWAIVDCLPLNEFA